MTCRPKTNPGKGGSRIAFLDYLRIFAFLSVLIGHEFMAQIVVFARDPQTPASLSWLVSLVTPFCQGGGAGVVVFFLVSGYIITFVLQTEDTRAFLFKRFFRIYPLYILAVCAQISLNYFSTGGKLPPASTVIPQLLLLGDFFATPYSLAGVEWTLRVELLFYLLMAAFSYLGLLNKGRQWLPVGLLLVLLVVVLTAPWPYRAGFKGYTSIFGPFLILGCFFFLAESRQISRKALTLFLVLILFIHYALAHQYAPRLNGLHFAALGVGIFLLAWKFRANIPASPTVVLLSGLTYSVYLFHNWLFPWAKKHALAAGLQPLWADIAATTVLFAVCYCMMELVEKKGIAIGKRLHAACLFNPTSRRAPELHPRPVDRNLPTNRVGNSELL